MPREALDMLRALGELADRRGVGAYVVGGLVRDLILEIPNYDLDVVVEEIALDFAGTAAARLHGTVKSHTRFGTVILVPPGGPKVDIATARKEAYERPGALPVVASGTIREDLRRRDFTINSMAVTINCKDFGTLLDFFSGLEDLEAGVLRSLHARSFLDDPTRILRGIRFAARFGFSFEKETERLLRCAVRDDALTTVTGERIRNELELILTERGPWKAVSQLVQYEILEAIDPAWSIPDGTQDVFERIDPLIDTATTPGCLDEAVRWHVFLLAMLEPVVPDARRAIVDRLAPSSRMRRLADQLERFERERSGILSSGDDIERSALYRSLGGYAPETLILAMARWPGSRAADRVALYLSELQGTTTELSGHDLAAIGVPEGRSVGRILSGLLEARLDGRVTSRDDELRLARKMMRDLDEADQG
jgi:tRNA nucleotidyltransferase (CCA-adding enzyme)